MKIKELTRKSFLKSIGISLSAIILLLWRGLVNDIIKHRRKEKIYLPNNPVNDITILNDIIIIKKSNELLVYSSKCTHLGCKINNQKGNYLICPCHGSRFNTEGKAIKGPAVKNLNKLTIYKDINNGNQFVYVS